MLGLEGSNLQPFELSPTTVFFLFNFFTKQEKDNNMYNRCFERKVQSTEEFRGKWRIDGVEKTEMKKCQKEEIRFFLDFFFFLQKRKELLRFWFQLEIMGKYIYCILSNMRIN